MAFLEKWAVGCFPKRHREALRDPQARRKYLTDHLPSHTRLLKKEIIKVRGAEIRTKPRTVLQIGDIFPEFPRVPFLVRADQGFLETGGLPDGRFARKRPEMAVVAFDQIDVQRERFGPGLG